MALLTKQHMHSSFLHKTPKEGFLAGHSSGELGQAPDQLCSYSDKCCIAQQFLPALAVRQLVLNPQPLVRAAGGGK